MNLSDQDFNNLKNKDRAALENFYRQHRDNIYNFLLIKTNGNKIVAEEVFSDTVYSILKSIDKIKTNKNINSWALQIASRRLYDYFQKNKNNVELIDDFNYLKDNINEEVKNDEKLLLTNLAMEALNPEFKAILEMKYNENMEVKEIAKKLDKSALSVQSLLYRARESLKKELKKKLKDFE
jgi:RNA polymerase sigma-70 factor, ECF subfamily